MGQMEELGVPKEYRVVVHKLYEWVRAKIKTKEGMSECFSSDIGVKQGCTLSHTLFALYIDNIEEWISNNKGEAIQLVKYVVKLLFGENFKDGSLS